jgi:sulfate transport system ATP-binding protein
MNVTSVFVTHDQEEAMEVADRIVVMNQGRIEQDGAPDEVYDHPASPFVLQFLGDVNLFRHGGEASATTAGFQGDGRTAYVRPHELQVVADAAPGSLPVTLAQALTVGPNTRLEFRRIDGPGYVDVEMPRPEWIALRDRLGLKPGSSAHLLPRKVTRFSSEDIDPAAMI